MSEATAQEIKDDETRRKEEALRGHLAEIERRLAVVEAQVRALGDGCVAYG